MRRGWCNPVSLASEPAVRLVCRAGSHMSSHTLAHMSGSGTILWVHPERDADAFGKTVTRMLLPLTLSPGLGKKYSSLNTGLLKPQWGTCIFTSACIFPSRGGEFKAFPSGIITKKNNSEVGW